MLAHALQHALSTLPKTPTISPSFSLHEVMAAHLPGRYTSL